MSMACSGETGARYAELVAATNFSFLQGASHPADMVAEAMALGQDGLGIADRNSVAGVVRAWRALNDLRERGEERPFRLISGARLVFVDGTPDIIAYPITRRGWGRLTRLLTTGNLRAQKGDCRLFFGDLTEALEDMALILLPTPETALATADAGFVALMRRLAQMTPHLWIGTSLHRTGRDRRLLAGMRVLSAETGVPLIAVNDALYARPEDRPLQDILTCIRLGTSIDKAGRQLAPNAERHLKTPAEMARLFAEAPEALAETLRLLDIVQFDLGQLAYDYPHEPIPPGYTPQGWLEALVADQARARWPEGVPPEMQKLLDEELEIVGRLNYAAYFLTVHDIVQFAQSQGILCQGRGSAANSAICFVLGITAVDPARHKLLFSRFMSEERREPPDIDVDFEHERREEVMQYIYARYGRHRAGIVATVIHYRPRSAVREVGKALGLTEDVTQRLSATVWGSHASKMEESRFAESGFDPHAPEIARLNHFVQQILHFPRHLSQHVGGFVLTEDWLDETVPILNAAMDGRTFIEWDKDDIDALGLMKVDILALGMLTCIRKAFTMIDDLRRARGEEHPPLSLSTFPDDDPGVFDMLCAGDSIGVFQVESRAQMNMLPRMKPRHFYDLAIQVAIVRPGPIQGDMVHPYLRRRQGREVVSFPSPAAPHDRHELRDVLGKTLGVPLFQEQAMKLAIVAADFTPGEANQLRRAMATFRNLGTINAFRDKLITGMVARGYQQDFAERCFRQIEGFGAYGFPESHAIAFARLVWVSAWIKHHEPAAFAAALLNSQPMGFYAPAQIVRDAREHGVPVDPVDVNASTWDNQAILGADGRTRLRLGFRQISGFREDWAEAIAAHRPYDSLEQLARTARLPSRALRLLTDADAVRSLRLDRRGALWEAQRMPADELPLFAAARARELGAEPDMALPDMALGEHVVADYQTLRLSLKEHPMALLRPVFRAEKILSAMELYRAKAGARVAVAGLVLVRQRPGKGNAVFITLEDETGVANIILWARSFEAQRSAVMAARLMEVQGEVQRSPEGIVHLMAHRIIERNAEILRLSDAHLLKTPPGRGDAFAHPIYPRMSHPRDVRTIPKSRDFH